MHFNFLFHSLYFTNVSFSPNLLESVLDRPPCLERGLKEVLGVTTFCKVVPSTL